MNSDRWLGRFWLLGFSAVVLGIGAGCGGSEPTGADGAATSVNATPSSAEPLSAESPSVKSPVAGSSTTWPEASPSIDGPVIRHPGQGETGGKLDVGIGNKLHIVGECLYLGTTPGERYPVVWPSGTTWDAEAEEVVLSDGRRFPIGDTVTGAGGFVDSSVVADLTSPEAADLVVRCYDGLQETFVFNNYLGEILGP